MTTICRVGFCQKCYDSGRPKTHQFFYAVGSSSGKPFMEEAVRNGRRGFVPHIYELKKVQDNKIYYRKICSMCDCGSYLVETTKGEALYLLTGQWSKWLVTTIDNWNALVLFTDTGLEV